MKKILCAVLIMVICCGALSGCGGKTEEKKEDISWEEKEIPGICGYKIPDSWDISEEKHSDTRETYYYKYTIDNNIGEFTIENVVLDNPKDGDALADEDASKWVYDELKEINESELVIGKQHRKMKSYSFKKEDKTWNLQRIGASYGDGYLLLNLEVNEKEQEKYKGIFEKIIESVSIYNTYAEEEETKKEEKSLAYILLQDTMRWNMALEEVKDAEEREQDIKGTFESKNPSYLSYIADSVKDKYASSVNCVYCFQDNQLKAYWCTYDSKKMSTYKELYEEVKNKVVEKYGECESEQIQWTDTTYQNDESKWNDAFRYGYVTIETKWHTEDTAIIIKWDYQKGMSVSTSALDFESQL